MFGSMILLSGKTIDSSCFFSHGWYAHSRLQYKLKKQRSRLGIREKTILSSGVVTEWN